MAYHLSRPLNQQKDRGFLRRTVQSKELRNSRRFFANGLGLHPEREKSTNEQSVGKAVAVVYTSPNRCSGA